MVGVILEVSKRKEEGAEVSEPTPNDFYNRSCEISDHQWASYKLHKRCIWCGSHLFIDEELLTTENGTPPKGHQESEHAKIIGDAKWLTLAIKKAKRNVKNDPR